jgi:hypothetical protein
MIRFYRRANCPFPSVKSDKPCCLPARFFAGGKILFYDADFLIRKVIMVPI